MGGCALETLPLHRFLKSPEPVNILFWFSPQPQEAGQIIPILQTRELHAVITAQTPDLPVPSSSPPGLSSRRRRESDGGNREQERVPGPDEGQTPPSPPTAKCLAPGVTM